MHTKRRNNRRPITARRPKWLSAVALLLLGAVLLGGCMPQAKTNPAKGDGGPSAAAPTSEPAESNAGTPPSVTTPTGTSLIGASVELKPERPVFKPGENIVLTMKNNGKTNVYTGRGFDLMQKDGEGWKRFQGSGDYAVTAEMIIVEPGKEVTFTIYVEQLGLAEPGRYRVYYDATDDEHDFSKKAAGEFEIGQA